MFTFLMIVQMLVAAALVAVILMQRSEGGGLGVGSSSSGLMTARGAADFLTRATAILATIFVVLSISLAAYATVRTGPSEIDTTLAKQAPATSTPLPGAQVPVTPGATGGVPLAEDPLAAAAKANAERSQAAAATNRSQGVPLAR
ncbi:MAG TPA: preprotein translocase subunit SecG [Allosphingosinicella sp.]|nr:preprotein translocase subunit SecG [Allosphingosinicella sp.]